jgi:signal transduction histidine kinase
MQAISNIATLFFLRAREHQQIRSTLGRYMFDLGNDIIHHSYVTEARGLSTNLETAGRQIADLIDDLQTLYDYARHIPLAAEIHIEQRAPLRINDVVRTFIASSGAFYHHPTIDLRAAYYLADSETVNANALGVGEALQILVDNAFEVLSAQPYGGHEIVISTDGNADEIVLSVSNTGPPLSEKNSALVENDIADWGTGSQGLVKLKALISLYGASLRLTQNDTECVTFAIIFPRIAKLIPVSGDDVKIRQLQRGIASHSALLHARVVSERAPQLQQRSHGLHKKLEDIRTQTESLTADFGVKLYESVQIALRVLLTDFVAAVNRRQPNQQRAVPVEYLAQPTDNVNIYASWVGLREVLRNLINNARQAILERDHPSDGADTITISAECERSRVRIHVHNTGSYIPYDIANRLFEYEITGSRGSGRGLLLSNLLLAAFGGSIRLTMNDRKRGVRFTIELPHRSASN